MTYRVSSDGHGESALPEQLRSLFKIRYAERFGLGVRLKAQSASRETAYHAINTSLRTNDAHFRGAVTSADLSNALGKGGGLARLVELCIDDLAPAHARTGSAADAAVAVDPYRAVSVNEPAHQAERDEAFCKPPRAEAGPLSDDTGPRRAAGSELSDHARARQIRWVGKGQSVTVGTFDLSDPLIYISEGAPSQNDAFCIDVRLEVGRAGADGARLGLYPTYRAMTPHQRATYLEWIARAGWAAYRRGLRVRLLLRPRTPLAHRKR